MTVLPPAPPEVPVDRSLVACAPKFREAGEINYPEAMAIIRALADEVT